MSTPIEDAEQPSPAAQAAPQSFIAIGLVVLVAIAVSVFALFIPTDQATAPGQTLVCPAPDDWNTRIFDPAPGETVAISGQTPSQDIKDVAILVIGVTVGIFVVVEGFLVLTIIRCRRRNDIEGEPVQLYGSSPIELAWTVVPILIVGLLCLVTIRTINTVQLTEPPEGSLRVQVIGHQWWWEFRYPDHGVVTANELIVPVDTPIWLELSSADVVHSFWVPRLSGKMDLIPNRVNYTWFQTSEEGWFYGQCAEYCGNQHANMLIGVDVRSEAGFDEWVASQVAPMIASEELLASSGHTMFLKLACQSCHPLGHESVGTFAPDLTHLMSRERIASGLVPNTEANLRTWLADPQDVKPGCNMPSLKLSEPQLDALVAFLITLK